MGQPGIFLLHPPTATTPLKPSAASYGFNRVGNILGENRSQYFIPSVPIEIPSETVIVLKVIDFPPAPLESLVRLHGQACRYARLHGVTSDQVVVTPMIGFLKSSFLNPTAYSIPRLKARSGPSRTGA